MKTKRLALVTGGPRGIGAAISVVLKEAGYKVAANFARNEEAAQAFSKETGIPSFKWNVASYQECEQGVAIVEKTLGQTVDILINNAGITADGMMHKMAEEAWHKVIETNLTSCFNMSRVVINAMRDKGFGRIVNISSVNAQTGQLGQCNYSAAKAGMLGFTKTLAQETAKKGITVNSVAPGYIETDMVREVSEEILNSIIAKVPVGRLGKPEEVARCIMFLIAEEAGFITGETMSVNGGYYME